jgi:CPA2 family monovalent cation:H+ antiporter-2
LAKLSTLTIAMPYILAAGQPPPFLTEVVALVVAGAIIAYICFRFNLVPIVGFLLAGVLIGPNALGIVRNQNLVNSSAEVGVILLLFTIGIEFSLEKLARIKRLIFVGGGLQVALASLATMGALAAFGVNWRAGLFTGFLVALSSTAIVLKLLGDRGDTSESQGQVGLGLLIFQDLAIIIMVLLVPILSGSGGSTFGIVWALLKALGIITIVLVFARRLMPKILEQVALTCSPELFLLAVIAICFGTAYLTSLAGVSLSLGAFLAGLLVSESRFSEHALGETMPLQILFSATFFVSVGMLLDLRFLIHNPLFVLAAIAVVLVIKVLTTGVSVLALGYKLPIAVSVALMLGQVGEFSFVLERSGREVGLFPVGIAGSGSQLFIATTVVLMILTPFLTQFGSFLARRLEARKVKRDAVAVIRAEPSEEDIPHLENHVIVAGYGQASRRLVRVLSGSNVPFIITTLSPTGANEAEADGLPVVRGDASKQRLLLLVGIERAKMMVIADDDPATALRISSVARTLNPTFRIVVRTRYIAEIELLTKAGVDSVIAEELESIVQLFAEVLRDYQIPAEEIQAHEATVRRSGYQALLSESDEERPSVECDVTRDCLETRTVIVRAGMPVTNRSLAGLDLEAKYNLALKSIRRDGKDLNSNFGNLVLRARDELILSGTATAFAESASLFRDSRPPNRPKAGPSRLASSTNQADFVDTERVIELSVDGNASKCSHLGQIHPVLPSARGCEECLKLGDTWVHLRICMTCGHVGCCDSSKNKHATKHFSRNDHPIIKSLQPGEDWAWCYPDNLYL